MTRPFFILLSAGLLVVYLQACFVIKSLEKDNFILERSHEVLTKRLVQCMEEVKGLTPNEEPPVSEAPDAAGELLDI